MAKVSGILNSRPLTPVSSDLNHLEPLTPNQLLLLPSLPIGSFGKEDSYSKRRRRQVRYMSDIFWMRYYWCLSRKRRICQIGKGSDEFDSSYKTSNEIMLPWRIERTLKSRKPNIFFFRNYERISFITTNSSTIQRIEDLCSCLSSDSVDELCRDLRSSLGRACSHERLRDFYYSLFRVLHCMRLV